VIFYYEKFYLEIIPFTLFKCWWLAWGTQVYGHPWDGVFLRDSFDESSCHSQPYLALSIIISPHDIMSWDFGVD